MHFSAIIFSAVRMRGTRFLHGSGEYFQSEKIKRKRPHAHAYWHISKLEIILKINANELQHGVICVTHMYE